MIYLLGEQRYVSAWQAGRSMPVAQVMDILAQLLEVRQQPRPVEERLNQGMAKSSMLSSTLH